MSIPLVVVPLSVRIDKVRIVCVAAGSRYGAASHYVRGIVKILVSVLQGTDGRKERVGFIDPNRMLSGDVPGVRPGGSQVTPQVQAPE